MAYTKTSWVDKAVQFATRYLKTGETSSGVTLTADPGTITQAGTPVNAGNLNKIEQGIFDAHTNAAAAQTTADAALARSGGTMTGQLVTANSTGAIGVTTSTHKLEVKGNGGVGDAAYMAFHRPGSYASMFGIDTDNKWKIGGWSAGAIAYELWHDGRMRVHSSGTYVEWNNGGGTWLPVGVLFDKTAMLNLFSARAQSLSATTTYANVVSISGKGYLDYANVEGHTNEAYIKVIVDGVTKFEGSSNASIAGLMNRSLIQAVGTTSVNSYVALNPREPLGGSGPFINNSVVDYPNTSRVGGGNTNVICLSPDSVYFSSSLVIQIKSGAANNTWYSYSGGYQ